MLKLNRLYYLKIEIRHITEQIEELTLLKASATESIPKGKSNSSPVEQAILQIEKLTNRLSAKLQEYVEEREKIEKFIDEIPDDEVRAIASMRYIDNLDYRTIGEKTFMDYTVAYRKLKKYIDEVEGNEKQSVRVRRKEIKR